MRTRSSGIPICRFAAAAAVVCFAGAPRVAATVRTSDRFDGSLGVEVAIIPDRNATMTTGVFTLSTIPTGARIVRASLYVHSWSQPGSPTATISGNTLPAVPPYDEDLRERATLYVYRFDVTPFMTGSGSYAASAGPVGESYGLALVVVFEHPSLPVRTVFVNDGADAVSSLASTSFEGALRGTGELWVFVQADDPQTTGEQIRFNGAVVGGPLDGNLGQASSLVQIPVLTQVGSNSLEIESFGDLFGWHLAVLAYEEECTAGNVNGGAGGVTDVLFVNDSAGGAARRVTAARHEPFSIFVTSPPAAIGPSPFALFAWAGLPDEPVELPGGVGRTCLPMPPSGGHRRLKVIWNNAGRFSRLGAPTFPSSPAPSLVYSDPDGLGREATFFLQGVIVDPGSPSGRAAVTNGVTVIVR